MKSIKTPSFELAVFVRGRKDAKKLALVLPGRLDTKYYLHMKSHVGFLARKGYLACSFDPPGTWESPGDITLYTMTSYLKAINELIAYFGSKPTVLMGHSRGGSMAMLAGTRNDCVTHIIAVMSSPSPSRIGLDSARKNGFETSYRDTPAGGKRKFVLPLSFFEDAAKYHMLDALAKCTKPKLYILGKHDKLVAPELVKVTFERSARPKQLYEMDSGHDYRFHPDKIREVNRVVGRFLHR